MASGELFFYLFIHFCIFKNILIVIKKGGGAWVAQSVERLTSAEVMMSQFVSSSPVSGSVQTAQSLEPASDSVSFCLSIMNKC